MTTSVVECSKCHKRFNYEWSRGAAPGAIMQWNRSIFKCPDCKQLNSFNLANSGHDPTLPTYNDLQVGLGGRVWGLLLGPFVGLMAVGVVLSITLTASPYYQWFLVPFLCGFAWLAAYIWYLNKKLGP